MLQMNQEGYVSPGNLNLNDAGHSLGKAPVQTSPEFYLKSLEPQFRNLRDKGKAPHQGQENPLLVKSASFVKRLTMVFPD